MLEEGYVQIICEIGHYNEELRGYHHHHRDEDYRCPRCGGKVGWSHHVDTSRGFRVGYVPDNILHDMFFLHYMTNAQGDGEAIYRVPRQDEASHLVIDDADPWDEMLR